MNVDPAALLRLSALAINLGASSLAVTSARGRKKPDGSLVCAIDLVAEYQLVQYIKTPFPGMGILSEESHAAVPRALTYASVDSLDGTSAYLRGQSTWSFSIGILSNGRPVAGLVVQPALGVAFMVIRGEGVSRYESATRTWTRFARVDRLASAVQCIGTDFGSATPACYSVEVEKVARAMRLDQAAMLAVHAGIQVLCGTALCWWSHTAHRWDVAAVTLMLEEIGGVAECLDGARIPWDRIKLPPVILAGSVTAAQAVRRVLS